ncbi:MAG: hypothetical protein IJJ14_06900 [Coriobacteriales bacterium]|nr:hypothetical protein [Coriobacteriales bacterium]MBQ6586469.1 hypothetical protein [Coriobacteriales bacterium]
MLTMAQVVACGRPYLAIGAESHAAGKRLDPNWPIEAQRVTTTVVQDERAIGIGAIASLLGIATDKEYMFTSGKRSKPLYA